MSTEEAPQCLNPTPDPTARVWWLLVDLPVVMRRVGRWWRGLPP